MDNLLTFLRARLADDEVQAADTHHSPCCAHWAYSWGYEYEPENCDCGVPARIRAEVKAKRRLIDEILEYQAGIDGEWGCCHDPDAIAVGGCPEISPNRIVGLRLLALPYAGHPDYRDEWKP